MSKKHDINTYSKLATGASFFLEESFKYVNAALEYEFASILFSQLLDKIEPNEDDRKRIANLDFPENTIELLQFDNQDVLSDETSKSILKAWRSAQIQAAKEKHKFAKSQRINSIEILGHLNNFGFFIETLVNRHLLFLNQTKALDDFSYTRVSTSRIMERIIYIFKEELNNKLINLNEVQNLFKLRNKTVHFTPDNAKALKPKISELIQIWTQCAKLLEKLEEKEKFNDEIFSKQVIYYSLKIQEKWN